MKVVFRRPSPETGYLKRCPPSRPSEEAFPGARPRRSSDRRFAAAIESSGARRRMRTTVFAPAMPEVLDRRRRAGTCRRASRSAVLLGLVRRRRASAPRERAAACRGPLRALERSRMALSCGADRTPRKRGAGHSRGNADAGAATRPRRAPGSRRTPRPRSRKSAGRRELRDPDPQRPPVRQAAACTSRSSCAACGAPPSGRPPSRSIASKWPSMRSRRSPSVASRSGRPPARRRSGGRSTGSSSSRGRS